jgi:DNA-directed RNA polymerase specialized sigma24 family protein
VANDRDLTGLLQAWSQGDRDALAVLATVVNMELREMARRILADERRDGRWRPTDLVQESYLRLLDWRAVRWQNRAHFFSTVAGMMRRVLVDAARAGPSREDTDRSPFRSPTSTFQPPPRRSMSSRSKTRCPRSRW